LDPIKFEIGQKTAELQKKNLKNLMYYLTKIVNSIFQSVDKCPRAMRVVFGFLQEEVSKRFPDDPIIKYSAVSGFIFLRFFCPAVLGPKLFTLREDNPDETVSRTLTLVAKALQNLANGVNFGQKEEYMAGLNDFMSAEKDSMRFFIDTLSNNWTSVRERVNEIESQIETEDSLASGLESTYRLYSEKNQDLGSRKARGELQKNIERSRSKVLAMKQDIEKLKRMGKLDREERQFDVDLGKLFPVDIEKELAAIHRHIVRKKDAVLDMLRKLDDGKELANDLICVLADLEEIRNRLETN